LLAKLVRLASHEKDTRRGEFARDEMREIGPDGWENTWRHETTL